MMTEDEATVLRGRITRAAVLYVYERTRLEAAPPGHADRDTKYLDGSYDSLHSLIVEWLAGMKRALTLPPKFVPEEKK